MVAGALCVCVSTNGQQLVTVLLPFSLHGCELCPWRRLPSSGRSGILWSKTGACLLACVKREICLQLTRSPVAGVKTRWALSQQTKGTLITMATLLLHNTIAHNNERAQVQPEYYTWHAERNCEPQSEFFGADQPCPSSFTPFAWKARASGCPAHTTQQAPWSPSRSGRQWCLLSTPKARPVGVPRIRTSARPSLKRPLPQTCATPHLTHPSAVTIIDALCRDTAGPWISYVTGQGCPGTAAAAVAD